MYHDLRNTLFGQAKLIIQNFDYLNVEEKMCAVLSNNELVKVSAKILHEILIRKRSFTYN